jgi:hypothetical protein
MQAQKTFQFVSFRFIALAFSLLVALLLASAAGYMIRGGGTASTGSTVAPPTLHVQQLTDNQMERQQTIASPKPRNLPERGDGFGFGL